MGSLRQHIGVVLQNNILFSGTVRDNLRWGAPTATDEELLEAARDAQAHEFILHLPDGLDTVIEQGRDQCLRRAAATPVHRPSAAQKTMHSDTGRFHVCSRFYHGTPYFPIHFIKKIPEHHHTAGSAADFIRAKCRPHHRSGWIAASVQWERMRNCCKTAVFTKRSTIPNRKGVKPMAAGGNNAGRGRDYRKSPRMFRGPCGGLGDTYGITRPFFSCAGRDDLSVHFRSDFLFICSNRSSTIASFPNIGNAAPDWSPLLHTLVRLAVLYLLTLAASYGQSVLSMILSERCTNRLRANLF